FPYTTLFRSGQSTAKRQGAEPSRLRARQAGERKCAARVLSRQVERRLESGRAGQVRDRSAEAHLPAGEPLHAEFAQRQGAVLHGAVEMQALYRLPVVDEGSEPEVQIGRQVG